MQTEILYNEIEITKPNAFRTIHYLGSKLRVLDFIKKVIDEVDPNKHAVCDLFAGTGSVSKYLSYERNIVSVDIQNYSNVICSALLNPASDNYIKSFIEELMSSTEFENNSKNFKELIALENRIINGDLSTNLEFVCNFLENASLYAVMENEQTNASSELTNAIKQTLLNTKDIAQRNLATIYFGGTYFSFRQAVDLDTILNKILTAPRNCQNTLMASLLSTASDIVNTVGKQFAQPIRPRNKNGEPKKGIVKQLKKDRDLDVLSIFIGWVNKYTSEVRTSNKHVIMKTDFREALKHLDDDVKVIYADPPYTRDHYSRFYHGLETLSLVDYPKVSRTKIGGYDKLSRGLYRENREQSEFCIRSKAPKAFDDMFKYAALKNKILVLSYSPYDKSKGAHPRVVEIEQLENIASKYFNNIEIRSIGRFSHSKLNKSELHLDAEEYAEVLIICRN